MAENETPANETAGAGAAVQDAPNFNIRVEDAGPATKKIHVEVPPDAVKQKIEEQYKELRTEAAIPGFRKGHAPRKLIEKKFAGDVREQVRRTLISESYQHALESNKLSAIGEPEFDNPDAIELKDDQALTYSFSIEVQPDLNVPELKGLKVKRPKITVTDEHINQAMTNLREQQGTMVPVEDRGVEEKDTILADMRVKVDGNEISHKPDTQMVVRPGRIAGVQVDDLPAQLAGAKPDDTRTITIKVPDDSPLENLRGKEVVIDVVIKEIKRLEAAEIDPEFLESLGFENEQELRDALKEQMDERIDYDIKQAMRRQVVDQLLTQVSFELPSKLSQRQTDRVVQRRAMDLMTRGVAREALEANIERLRAGAGEEASRELKTFFILQKVAETMEVDVNEGELNGRIAMIAMQQGRRPEKLKQEMARDGNTLANLYVQMREEKAIDEILKTAEIEDVEATAAQQKAVSEPPSAEGESSAT